MDTADADARVDHCFRQYGERVYRDLLGYCGCEVTAEDLTQQAFLRLWNAFAAGEAIDRPDAWVFREARRLLLRRLSLNIGMSTMMHLSRLWRNLIRRVLST